MTISIIELARARELLGGLLDELGLAAYRFEAEPEEADWRIVVECEADGSWQTVNLRVPAEALERAQIENDFRRTLLGELAESLDECRRLVAP